MDAYAGGAGRTLFLPQNSLFRPNKIPCSDRRRCSATEPENARGARTLSSPNGRPGLISLVIFPVSRELPLENGSCTTACTATLRPPGSGLLASRSSAGAQGGCRHLVRLFSQARQWRHLRRIDQRFAATLRFTHGRSGSFNAE